MQPGAFLLATLAADLQYPTPPNPFATPGASSNPIPPPPTTGKPIVPPPPIEPRASSSSGGIGGSERAASAFGAAAASSEPRGGEGGLLGGVEPMLAPPAEQPLPVPPSFDPDAAAAAAPTPSSGLAKPARRRLPLWRSVTCLAALSAACAMTRPHETSLVTALDAHRSAFGHLEASLPMEAELPLEVLNLGLGSAAVHGELVWLGLLGRWLPLLPTTADAIEVWSASLEAPQLVMFMLTGGYLARKLLPGHFSTSFDALLRRGRVHTLLTAGVAPLGLAHWLHAIVVGVVAASELSVVVGGRRALIGWWAASGAAAALGCVLTQLLFGRRATPRSTVSAAAMGLLLLRTSAMPSTPIAIGAVSLPPLRCVLIHLVRLVATPSRPAARPRPRRAAPRHATPRHPLALPDGRPDGCTAASPPPCRTSTSAVPRPLRRLPTSPPPAPSSPSHSCSTTSRTREVRSASRSSSRILALRLWSRCCAHKHASSSPAPSRAAGTRSSCSATSAPRSERTPERSALRSAAEASSGQRGEDCRGVNAQWRGPALCDTRRDAARRSGSDASQVSRREGCPMP